MTIDQRIVFLDVDGTLIDHDEHVPASAVEAVHAARENGHLVYLCTGRSRVEIPAEVRAMGYDGAITAAGAFAEVGDELVLARTMSSEWAQRMVDTYERLGLDYYLQSFDEILPSDGLADRFLGALRSGIVAAGADLAGDEALARSLEEHPIVQQLRRLHGSSVDGIAKSIFVGDGPEAYAAVQDALGDHFDVLTGTIGYVGAASGEVSLTGVNKGTAIASLLETLGLPREASIGIGDGSNDLEMLAYCGVGIAMPEGNDAVRAAANEVTTGLLDDGIARALERHGLARGITTRVG